MRRQIHARDNNGYGLDLFGEIVRFRARSATRTRHDSRYLTICRAALRAARRCHHGYCRRHIDFISRLIRHLQRHHTASMAAIAAARWTFLYMPARRRHGHQPVAFTARLVRQLSSGFHHEAGERALSISALVRDRRRRACSPLARTTSYHENTTISFTVTPPFPRSSGLSQYRRCFGSATSPASSRTTRESSAASSFQADVLGIGGLMRMMMTKI